jgi:hypothetical protein
VTAAISYAVWAVLGAGVLGLWAWSRRPGSTVARPSVVLGRLATGPVSRVLLVLVWMFLGWHAFAR